MKTLTCSEWQGIVLEQLSLRVQEPLGAKFLGVAPEVGVTVETPQVHEHHGVLHQDIPEWKMRLWFLYELDQNLEIYVQLLTLGML